MNVYDELCDFALVHRSCGEIHARIDSATEWPYGVLLRCSCGTELRRSVTREDASEDLRAERELSPVGRSDGSDPR